MMKGDHGPTKLLHALTWGAFDHAFHAPQVRACIYYLHIMLLYKLLANIAVQLIMYLHTYYLITQ